MQALDRCLDLIRSHQQCIRDFRHWRSNQWLQNAESKLSLSYQSTSNAKSTIHGNFVTLVVTVSSVKSTDVTYKTHSGLLTTQLQWLVDLASLVCVVGWWSEAEFRLCILQSLVRSLVRGGDHSMHCWWNLISSKQLSSVSVSRAKVFARFSGHGNSIYNIIPLLERKCTFISLVKQFYYKQSSLA